MILALALACPRTRPPAAEVGPETVAEAPLARAVLSGPAYWSEPGGLCLEVPAGWVGSSGPPPVVLALEQPSSGFGFELVVAEPELPPRAGFTVLFEDESLYRSIPILAEGALTRTWVSDDPAGPMIQTWSGSLGGRTIEIAASYPLGRSTEGELAVRPLLEAICTTWR